jgi:hypothetical protein
MTRKQLASLISEATSLRQLQELHDRHHHIMDPLHVSAMLSRVREVLFEDHCLGTPQQHALIMLWSVLVHTGRLL